MPKRIRQIIWTGFTVALVLVILSLGHGGYLGEVVGRVTESGPALPVHDLDSISTLQQAFNHDAGTPRLILIVSPT